MPDVTRLLTLLHTLAAITRLLILHTRCCITFASVHMHARCCHAACMHTCFLTKPRYLLRHHVCTTACLLLPCTVTLLLLPQTLHSPHICRCLTLATASHLLLFVVVIHTSVTCTNFNAILHSCAARLLELMPHACCYHAAPVVATRLLPHDARCCRMITADACCLHVVMLSGGVEYCACVCMVRIALTE